MSFVLLGILSAQAAGGAVAPGDYDLLESQRLDSTAASISFTNVNTKYAADYQSLQLRIVARTSSNEVGTQLKITLNGTDLAAHQFISTGTSVAQEYYTTEKIMAWVNGNNADANSFGAGYIDILDPFETTKVTTVRSMSGQTGSVNRFGLGSGFLNSTSAITSISLADRQGGNIVANSRVSLYGLRSVAV